jgi:iron complex outermembrane receptor protein
MGTTRQIFNAPFKPIVSELYETGVKANLFQNKMFATVSLYSLAVENVAVNANDPNQPDLYVQRGEQRSNGLEVELNGNITDALSAHFSYAYNKAKIAKSNIAEDVGKIIENAPLHSSGSWIKYSFQNNVLKGFAVSVGHMQQSKRNTLADGFTLPGFIIFDAGLQYNYKAFTIAANIENLTNKKYWLSAYNNVSKWPGEPRNFMMTVDYSF